MIQPSYAKLWEADHPKLFDVRKIFLGEFTINVFWQMHGQNPVYTFEATDLCELTIEDSAPGFGRGTGFLSGEYQDGMTKICVYDVLGESRNVRQNGVSICPLNYKL